MHFGKSSSQKNNDNRFKGKEPDLVDTHGSDSLPTLHDKRIDIGLVGNAAFHNLNLMLQGAACPFKHHPRKLEQT